MKFGRNQPRSQPIVRVARLAGPELGALLHPGTPLPSSSVSSDTAAVMPEAHVCTTLDTIKRCNVALSATGAVNYANADGSPAEVGGYGTYSYFPPELLMLAMTFIYRGERDDGLWLAQRCWENIVCKQRLTWDQPNFFRGGLDTGERDFGNDYYQNMMLWSLPAAIQGQPLHGPCAPGNLVDRIIQAGSRSNGA